METLTARDEAGDYKIPRIIYSDAYALQWSPMPTWCCPTPPISNATTAISLLDRPISDPDHAADAIRWPVVAPERPGHAGVRPFQSVLVDCSARSACRASSPPRGQKRYADYADYITRHERRPGVGPLMGFRGDGSQTGRGEPLDQIARYIANGGFFTAEVPAEARFFMWVQGDLGFAFSSIPKTTAKIRGTIGTPLPFNLIMGVNKPG